MISIELRHEHPWDVSPAEAREIQERLRERVSTRAVRGRISSVAGVDVGYEKSTGDTRTAIEIPRFPDTR